MKKSITAVSVLVLLSMLLSACNLTTPAQTQIPADQINTIAAQTVEALTTQMAPPTEAPTNTPEPATNTPEATATLMVPTLNLSPVALATNTLIPLPTSVNSSAECLKVFFLKDVTIKDNTNIAQKAEFTKTWQIQNSGSCTWTTAFYAMAVLDDPSSPVIHGEGYVYPKVNIAPGAIWEYSAKLIAPSQNGTYTQYWKMVDDQGNQFGIGGTSGAGWYVRIKVTKDGASAGDDQSITTSINPPGSGSAGSTATITGSITVANLEDTYETKYYVQIFKGGDWEKLASDEYTWEADYTLPVSLDVTLPSAKGTYPIRIYLSNGGYPAETTIEVN